MPPNEHLLHSLTAAAGLYELHDRSHGAGDMRKARAHADRLINALAVATATLEALRECPGVHHTDQKSGETFSTLIDAAIEKAGAL
jgi:hypothetical protein